MTTSSQPDSSTSSSLLMVHRVAIVVLFILAGYFGWEALQAHDAAMVAKQRDEDTKAQIAQIDQVRKDADAKLTQSLATQQAAFEVQIKTLQGQIQYLQSSVSSIPGLSKPIIIQPPSPNVPNAPVVASIPQVDVVQLDAIVKEYKDLKQEYPVCEADLKAANDKNALLQTDLNVQKKAAKGGGFWHNVKRDAKVVGYVAITVVVLLATSGHLK